MWQSAVYYPEDLSLLGEVLDQLVQSLPPNRLTPSNRAAIAKNILACASRGERDPSKLRRAALVDLKITGVTDPSQASSQMRRSHNRPKPAALLPAFGQTGDGLLRQ
jgi:hypothetical protein